MVIIGPARCRSPGKYKTTLRAKSLRGETLELWVSPVDLQLEVTDVKSRQAIVETIPFLFVILFDKLMAHCFIIPLQYEHDIEHIVFSMYLVNNTLSVNDIHTYGVSNNTHGVYQYKRKVTVQDTKLKDTIVRDMYREVLVLVGLKSGIYRQPTKYMDMMEVYTKVKNTFTRPDIKRCPAMQKDGDTLRELIMRRYIPSLREIYKFDYHED